MADFLNNINSQYSIDILIDDLKNGLNKQNELLMELHRYLIQFENSKLSDITVSKIYIKFLFDKFINNANMNDEELIKKRFFQIYKNLNQVSNWREIIMSHTLLLAKLYSLEKFINSHTPTQRSSVRRTVRFSPTKNSSSSRSIQKSTIKQRNSHTVNPWSPRQR